MNSSKNTKVLKTGLVLGAVVVGVTMLGRMNQGNKTPLPEVVVPVKEAEKPVEAPVVTPLTDPQSGYSTIKIATTKPGAEIAAVVGSENVNFVLTFNRLDAKHIQQGVTITIPPSFDDWNSLSPFPHDLSVAKAIPKLLVVSQRVQAFAAYENGTLVRWGVTSTGKKDTPTPSRLYSTNWKGKLVVSSLEGGYILPWAFNLDSLEGIAMHQFDLPGYPASHACVRLLEADAMWIYEWADQWILSANGNTELAPGTPVLIFGQYAFGKTAPWKKLSTDPNATTITEDELTKEINANLDGINKKVEKRQQLLGTNNS